MLLYIAHTSHDTGKVQRVVQGQQGVQSSEGVPLSEPFSFWIYMWDMNLRTLQ